MRLQLLLPAAALALLLLTLWPQGAPAYPGDDFIVVGGGPPSVAAYAGGQFLGVATLRWSLPNYTMYDALLVGDRLVVATGEVGPWIYIYGLDLDRPLAIVRAPGDVSHWLYSAPHLAPVEGGKLWVAASDYGAKRGHLCRLDVEAGHLEDCLDVGLYPHAPVALNGTVYVPLIREPHLAAVAPDGSVRRLRIDLPLKSFQNPHDPVRQLWLSFHMVTTDGRYIYGEGHQLDPGYRLAGAELHVHSYLVAMDLEGRVVAYYPTSAPPPGLPGLAACRGRLFATSPLEGALYVLEAPSLRPLAVLRLGKAPWGAFATPDCRRIYVTDILGAKVYVVDVESLRVVAELRTPMRYPHTVIFVDRDLLGRLGNLKPQVEAVGEVPTPVVACGDYPP